MRFQRVRKLVVRLSLAAAVLCAAFVLTAAIFAWHCQSVQHQQKSPSDAARRRAQLTASVKDYARDEDSTYLGYPEWFIVWSYTEKADYQQQHLPSGFPYFTSIRQYWSGYCCMHAVTRGRYAFNVGEHLMLVVIGTSFTFEYAIRSVYENTVGRMTEWSSSHQSTEEDVFSNNVARQYADFVHVRPFYEFSFWKRFKGLWSSTPVWGRHPVRKLERRLFLSADYALEALYCWIIEAGTHVVYGFEPAETYAWIDRAPASVFLENPRIRKVKDADGGSYVVIIPRYQEFTDVATWLADRDIHFVEIAGNDEILVTATAPRGWKYDLSAGRQVFATPIATMPARNRVAISTSVDTLHTVIRELRGHGLALEHVYDY